MPTVNNTKTINTPAGQTVPRELMIAYMNTGTSEAKKWSAIGKRVSSSDMSYDYSANTSTDILGITRTELKKPTIKQSFDPIPLDSEDEAIVKLWEMGIRDQDYRSLSSQEIMVAHFYAGSESMNFAEVYDCSAVVVSRNGGTGGDGLTIASEITYGGVRTIGTVSKGDNGVVFTAAAA